MTSYETPLTLSQVLAADAPASEPTPAPMEDTADEYLYCGALLDPPALTHTCHRRVSHQGECGPQHDRHDDGDPAALRAELEAIRAELAAARRLSEDRRQAIDYMVNPEPSDPDRARIDHPTTGYLRKLAAPDSE
jgi:hypothetical protein